MKSEYKGQNRHGSGFETLTIQDETPDVEAPDPRHNQEEIIVVDGETLEIVKLASDNGLKGVLETNFSVDPNQEIETRTSNGVYNDHPRPNNGITNGQKTTNGTNGHSANGFGHNSDRQLKSFSPGHKRQLSITKE